MNKEDPPSVLPQTISALLQPDAIAIFIHQERELGLVP